VDRLKEGGIICEKYDHSALSTIIGFGNIEQLSSTETPLARLNSSIYCGYQHHWI
jgi:hypothetical protein